MNTLIMRKREITTKTLITAISVVMSLLLPQLFHVAGTAAGFGGAVIGAVFLPMHIPVLMAGLLGGPVVGIIAGICSPVFSFLISGMPVVTLLPFMVVELAGYGLVAGLLAKRELPVVVKLLAAQAVGRVIRGLFVLITFYGMGIHAASPASVILAVKTGIAGIVLQLILIPLFVPKMKRVFSHE